MCFLASDAELSIRGHRKSTVHYVGCSCLGRVMQIYITSQSVIFILSEFILKEINLLVFSNLKS